MSALFGKMLRAFGERADRAERSAGPAGRRCPEVYKVP
jgi:hypothetical protein